MAEPPRLLGQTTSNPGPEDDDIDAEYEEDDAEYDRVTQENSRYGNNTDAEGSMVDAEGSDVDAEGEEIDEDEDEPVGAVKIAAHQDATSDEEDASDHDGNATADSASEAQISDHEDSDRSSSESEPELEWQAESEDGDDRGAGRESSNKCTFCNEDEEHDPSEEYEEYLTCAVCGDNAHRQCARNANTLSSDDDANHWRCLACLQDELDEDEKASGSVSGRDVPNLTRDLLPSHRGSVPSGHSVFNDLILPDDPLDGSRSLRKRKSSLEEETPAPRQIRKKHRSLEPSGSEAEDASRAVSNERATTRNLSGSESEDGGDDDGHPSASEQGSSRLRSSRARPSRPKRTDKRPLAWVEENTELGPLSIVVVFHLPNDKVQKILATKPKQKSIDLLRLEARRERDRERRERNRRAAAQQERPESPEVSHYPAIQSFQGAPFYGFADKEMDESKIKPYGGILSEADADTSKTYPTQADRKRFEDARLKAEEDWKAKMAASSTANEASRTKQASPASKIKCINFGGWEIDTWHAAPYPEEYSRNRVLYICEFCLKYMSSDYVAWRHKLKCPAKHPPGDEIYRDGKHSFFEVDGRKNPVYCQNLCLLAKLFLGSKTLYYDVEPFLFYVMTENDRYGCHFVGYFSKEKRPSSLNNVSCILVLPIYMRKGYGQYLIQFSYLLTRVEKKTGSPEKPLSDMGLVSYRKYWRIVLCEELLKQKGPISIAAISERTGMTADDIVSALEGLRALVRDPVTKSYALRLDYNYFKEYLEKCNANDNAKVNPDSLVWTPYVMGRLGDAYEDGPALHTIQAREEVDEEAKASPEEGVQQMGKAAKNGLSHTDSPAPEEIVEPSTPALHGLESTNGDIPAPGTPLANGSHTPIFESKSSTIPPIPPTRYEVFPPIPGMTTGKRRPGRPFGSRRRAGTGTGTPQRTRNTPLSIQTAPVPRLQLSPRNHGAGKSSPVNGTLTPSGSMSMRRTRSRLGESVVNGDGEETLDGGGGAVRSLNGGHRRTRSYTASPKTNMTLSGNIKGKGKGKGKAVAIAADEYLDEDADGESEDLDVDAEGEMDVDGDEDVDAEGEEDDEGDVAMGGA